MFLLRSRFRAIISSKQSRMDHTTPQTTSSTEQNQSTPFSSFFGSPRFFGGFLSRIISDEISASPTSILDTKQFCNSNNHPFVGYHENVFKPSSSPITKSADIKDPSYEQKGIGLVLEKEDFDSFSKPYRKMVIFGANLMKVKVPPFSDKSHLINTLESPGDYGIKTKNSHFIRSSSINSPCIRGKEDQEGVSLMEMELSEEYTCVMIHGPNPKTTHIFDDTIVETSLYGGSGNLSNLKNENNIPTKGNATSLPKDFLGFCYTCKVKLDNSKDIYIYRGEKGFCSPECRFQEMVMEEEGQGKMFNLDEDY